MANTSHLGVHCGKRTVQQVVTRKSLKRKVARLHQVECCFAGCRIGVAMSGDDQPLSEPLVLGEGDDIVRQHVFTQFRQLGRVCTVGTT